MLIWGRVVPMGSEAVPGVARLRGFVKRARVVNFM